MAPKNKFQLPPVVAVLALLAALFIFLPILALLWGADWGTFPADINAPSTLSALRLSLITALFSTLFCILLGVPLAFYLSGTSSWLSVILRILVNLPLVMPPLVGGLALLMLLGRRGLLGGLLFETMGIQLPFTTPAVIIAQVFVSMPFMVISLEGVLRSQDPTFALTAASLGASPWRVFWHVTLPMARAGLAAGTVLTFARALGEFGATALFAGNREGITQTMPLAIYTAFNGGGVSTSSAIALALLLLVVAFAVMMVTRSWYPKATK